MNAMVILSCCSRPSPGVSNGEQHNAPCAISPPQARGRIPNRSSASAAKKRWRNSPVVGGGPPFRKAGAAVLYEPKDLDAWALARSGRRAVPLLSARRRSDDPRANENPALPTLLASRSKHHAQLLRVLRRRRHGSRRPRPRQLALRLRQRLDKGAIIAPTSAATTSRSRTWRA